MEIRYLDVVLRDYEQQDIADDIRWYTEDTEWARWDAPWKMEGILAAFDGAVYRREQLQWMALPKPLHRMTLEIMTADGRHIGGVNTYCLDGAYRWKAPLPGEPDGGERWAMGIDICESGFRHRGWGRKALTAFTAYHLTAGLDRLYLQTWSGNEAMMALAEKLGFRKCAEEKDACPVGGERFDRVTFRLDEAAFLASCGGNFPEILLTE